MLNIPVVILYPEVAKESAEALKEELKNQGYTKVELINPYVFNVNLDSFGIIFKYGVSKPIKIKNNQVVINKRKEVLKSIDKRSTLSLLRDLVPTVPYTLSKEEALSWVEDGHVVVARKRAEGSNGAGVVYITNKSQLENEDAKFWTKYVQHTNEFRINVWRGKVVSIYDKTAKNGLFKFSLFKGNENHPQLTDIVTKIQGKIKLDWYGADFLCDSSGQLYLLEINSAPVLFPYTINKLVKAFKKEYN